MDENEVAPLRRDHGRGQHQLRPFAAEFGVLAKADGSARFSFGNSTVLAAVYGPVECPTRKEQADRATVEVYFKQTSSLQTTQDTEYGMVIKKSMESVILTALHPRTAIQITVQVINDDGSILAAALNAVSLALLDAGISMNSVVAATSLVVSKGQILNDPTTSEENTSQSIITLGFDNVSEGAVLSHTLGPLQQDAFWFCWDLAYEASLKIIDFFRLVMCKKNERIHKLLD